MRQHMSGIWVIFSLFNRSFIVLNSVVILHSLTLPTLWAMTSHIVNVIHTILHSLRHGLRTFTVSFLSFFYD